MRHRIGFVLIGAASTVSIALAAIALAVAWSQHPQAVVRAAPPHFGPQPPVSGGFPQPCSNNVSPDVFIDQPTGPNVSSDNGYNIVNSIAGFSCGYGAAEINVILVLYLVRGSTYIPRLTKTVVIKNAGPHRYALPFLKYYCKNKLTGTWAVYTSYYAYKAKDSHGALKTGTYSAWGFQNPRTLACGG